MVIIVGGVSLKPIHSPYLPARLPAGNQAFYLRPASADAGRMVWDGVYLAGEGDGVG